MAEQRYPHVGVREQDDTPNVVRSVQNRTILMASTSHRGFHKKATVVNADNYELVIGKTSHKGSIALEAMFGTYNPSRVLFRRVLNDARVASTPSTEGIKVTGTATAGGLLTVEVDPDGTSLNNYTVDVTVTNGDDAETVAQSIATAINAVVAPDDFLVAAPFTAELDRVKLDYKAAGAVGNALTYLVQLGTVPAGLVVTPDTATNLEGGADAPTQAQVSIPAAGGGNWVAVFNFHGLCGNEVSVRATAASAPGALFSLALIDDFLGKTTNFANLKPVATDFQNDGLGFGMKYLKLQSDLITLYYDGDLGVVSTAAPVTMPFTYDLTGGTDGVTPDADDFLREIAASGEDEATIILCPDRQDSQTKAALVAEALQATELSGLRQAIIQMALGGDLVNDHVAFKDDNGIVVSCTSWHTMTFRPELPPQSYGCDVLAAAAMATKPLHLSLADREAVAAVKNVEDTSVKSRNVDELNAIFDNGHEAIVFDPGTRDFRFLTGRTLASQDSIWSRSNNRQLENQFRTDLYLMLQGYKSRPTAGMLRALTEQVDNYFAFWRDVARAVASVKATVGDASNNPSARVAAGFARIDSFWAPLPLADNLEVVIHTYLDTTL